MAGQRVQRSSTGRRCRTASGRVRECGCSFCNTAICESGSSVLTSCTGRRIVRASMQASGSVDANAGTAGGTTGEYHATLMAEAFVSFSMDAILDATTSFDATASITKTVHVDYTNSLKSFDDLAPFGSVTAIASGSVTFSGGSADGTYALDLDSYTITVNAGFEVDATTSLFKTTTRIDFGFAFSTTSPDDPDLRVTYSIGGTNTVNRNGAIVAAGDLCALTSYSGTDLTFSDGSVSATDDQQVEPDEEQPDSSVGGDGTVTAQLIAAASNEESDPLNGKNCPRFVNLAAQSLQSDDTTEPEEIANITGRLTSGGVANCGVHFPGWIGNAEMKYEGTAAEGRPVAVTVSLGPTAIGAGGVRGVLLATIERGYVLTVTTTTPGTTFQLAAGGASTSALSATTPTSSAIQAALEALSAFAAPVVVRVHLRASDSSTKTFIVTVAGAPSFTLSVSSGPATLTSGTNFELYYPPLVFPGGVVASMPFSASNKCCTGTLTVGPSADFDNRGNGHGSTISVTPTSRIATDPTYYCDCATACEHTAVVIQLRNGVTKNLVGVQTDDDPCSYLIDTDDDYHGVYEYDSAYGRMSLTLSDDFGVVLTAHRYCIPGGQLGPLVIDTGSLRVTYPSLTAEAA